MPKIHHEDYAAWLSILKMGYVAYGINEPLADYRVCSTSLSGNKFKAMGWTWSLYRKYLKLGLWDPSLSSKEKNNFVKKVIFDRETKGALKNARPDNVEFRLYKIVLETKCIGLVKLFAMMRLTFKKIIGRS